MSGSRDPSANGDPMKRRGAGDARHGGLRPAVAAACRKAMRFGFDRAAMTEEARRHVDACAFCADRLRAAAELGGWLRQRPERSGASPAEVLGGIYDRVVTQAEEGPVGEWLDTSIPVPSPADAQPTLDDVMLESPLADALVRPPVPPSPAVWEGVRRTILDDVAAERARRRRPIGWRILLAGVAASAVIGLISTAERGADAPTIVFTDFDRAPADVEFAVVRYGSRR